MQNIREIMNRDIKQMEKSIGVNFIWRDKTYRALPCEENNTQSGTNTSIKVRVEEFGESGIPDTNDVIMLDNKSYFVTGKKFNELKVFVRIYLQGY